jgi:DNA-directed RNA polymerase specialized sigma24 family protein
MGGPVWLGEDDAPDALVETVKAADQTGRLRGILDAVRSHRIEDDFSSHWSYAREDFERKLHGKRRKAKVTFVELTDTIPVQGPESEVLGNVITNDFLALLDTRNRQIVVLLNSGVTSKTEIADILGYANHSAVSKRLAQIRRAAETFFDES